ncbi:hypothetical protein [Pseudomonas sp. R5(2019)]|uniref:hypothetical protein n=1 Tax=Pseudomonas sp. R5(2019) TaxID=2697566 RepID=UPI0014130A53|nr:hypothetical protein [Pseudomonas sp. R5(2019)]
MKKNASTFWPVFGMPSLIAVLGFAGLVTALLGDGGWDVLAWIGLGIPALLSLRGLCR